MFSSAGNDARAEDKIADRTLHGRRGPASPQATIPPQVAFHHNAAARRGAFARRSPALLNRHQRRSGTRGYHQLGRVVITMPR